MNDSSHTPSIADDDEGTGFGALPTWRSVYCVVIAIFFTWVALLTALSRAFR